MFKIKYMDNRYLELIYGILFNLIFVLLGVLFLFEYFNNLQIILYLILSYIISESLNSKMITDNFYSFTKSYYWIINSVLFSLISLRIIITAINLVGIIINITAVYFILKIIEMFFRDTLYKWIKQIESNHKKAKELEKKDSSGDKADNIIDNNEINYKKNKSNPYNYLILAVLFFVFRYIPIYEEMSINLMSKMCTFDMFFGYSTMCQWAEAGNIFLIAISIIFVVIGTVKLIKE